MPPRAEVAGAIVGAFRLLLFDAQALARFNLTVEGFWRSFFAAVLIAPFFALMAALELKGRLGGTSVAWVVAVEFGAYVVGWTIYPLLMVYVTRLLGLSHNYVPYIIVFNWGSVVRIAAFFPLIAIGSTGLVPSSAMATLMVVAILVALGYHWIVARVALGASAATTLGLVVLEFLLSLLLDLGTTRLLR